MATQRWRFVLLCMLIRPLSTKNWKEADNEFSSEDRWIYRSAYRPQEYTDKLCLRIRASSKDIIKRFYAILPYFDKDHSNSVFINKYRSTVRDLSDSDALDREAAFYAAVLTPIVFLQNHRESWCLLERFHRALRLYQMTHPSQKRASLKLLQNFRAVSQKVRIFVWHLPSSANHSTNSSPESNKEQINYKSDFRFIKELVKNFDG